MEFSCEQAFEAMPCYLSVQDRALNIVRANRWFERDFGDWRGRPCYQVYKRRTEKCEDCPVERTFGDGCSHSSEQRVRTLEGREVSVIVYTTPLCDQAGRVESVMEMSTDITQVRQLQSQLEGIGLLISSISHGIKGLLTGLDGGMYLVNSGLGKGDQRRIAQGWEMVQRNIDRIRSTVMNILYYAKDRVPRCEPIAAAALAAEAAELVAARAREHAVAFERELAADVGDCQADPRALRALLVNLLENSIDACRVDKKKDRHAVGLAVRGRPDHVEFEVRDNGIGMDDETREKAFSLFYSSKGVEGTGLGLFIAHKIATQHGGSIELDSELDRGTRFVVRIPRRQPAAATAV